MTKLKPYYTNFAAECCNRETPYRVYLANQVDELIPERERKLKEAIKAKIRELTAGQVAVLETAIDETKIEED